MANLTIQVVDSNNLDVIVDSSVSGVGISNVAIEYVPPSTYYLVFTYTNGTTENVELPSVSAGVASFNTRIGNVTLLFSDVTDALGYTPPEPDGTGATGTWDISVLGNAATVTNGVVTTGSYSNPSWITALAGSKITGDISGNAGSVTNGVYTIGNQTIGGIKTFSSTIVGSVSGNSGTVTNGVYTTDTGTVTNTMLAGSIANNKLSNSSITINGNSVSLGGSTTVTASTTSTLTIGTGLSGTSFNGSTPVTIAIANTGVTATSYGTASKTSTLAINSQGQVTSASQQDIAIANTQVSGLGTSSTKDAGSALGVATLDSSGKVPISQIPDSVIGALSYQGTWNALTNTPTLTSSVGTKGYYYVVSVAGSTNLNGITDWIIGDWAVYSGTAWQKIDNTDSVTSVNGYTGTVVLTQTDISGTVPTSRTLTAGTGLTGGGDLSANRTFAIDSTVATLTGTQTLTNKSISGTTNTLSNIGNSSLTNSAITINGTSTSLGGSISVGTVTSVAATAGTGISVSGSPITTSGTLTITNTAPDQTVAISAGTGISVTGTYPNFSVTNTAPSSGGTVTSVTGTTPIVSSGGNTPAISIPAATTSVSGYLTSTDWTTFNNKSNTNGTVTSVAALTLGTTGTDLSSTVANETTTPVITLNVPTASATNRGALSSTDWTTFNNKTSNTGTVTSVGGTGTVNGLTLTGTVTTSGSLTLGGTLDLSAPPAIGGTTPNTGKFTSVTDSGLTSGRVTYATTGGLLADSAGLTFDGTNFATTGNASAKAFIPTSATVPVNGMYLPAANAIGWSNNSVENLRLDAVGDLWEIVNASITSAYYRFGDGTTTYGALGGYRDSATTGHLELYTLTGGTSTEKYRIGNAGQWGIGGATYGTAGQAFLSGGASAAPTWGTLGVGGGGTGLTTLTAGYIPFGNGTSAFGSDAGLFWDNTNKRLGIGTVTPRFPLELVSPGTSTTGLEQVAFFRKTTTNQVGAALFVHDTLVAFGSNAYAGASNVAVALMSQAAGVGVYTVYGHPSGGVSIGNTTDPDAGSLGINGIVVAGTTTAVASAHTFVKTAPANRVFTIQNTNNTDGDQLLWLTLGTNCNTTNAPLLIGTHGTTASIIIWGNGNVVNTNNSYGTLSDIKLKTDITSVGSQWNDVKALANAMSKFKLLSDDKNTIQLGWIAQDVQKISAGLVFETKDLDFEGKENGEVTLGVNTSVAQLKAFKALGEALERIEQLEARLKTANIA